MSLISGNSEFYHPMESGPVTGKVRGRSRNSDSTEPPRVQEDVGLSHSETSGTKCSTSATGSPNRASASQHPFEYIFFKTSEENL